MANGYTYPVIEGTADARKYLELCARSRGFAVMQRDDPLDQPVEYREESDYYAKAIENDTAALDRWIRLSDEERRAEYRQYVDDTKRANEQGIAKAAVSLSRIQAVRDDIRRLEWPDDLHSMRDDALKWLDETEEWDCKPYTSPVTQYREWVVDQEAWLRRSVAYSTKALEDERKRVAETNRYIDLYRAVLAQLDD